MTDLSPLPTTAQRLFVALWPPPAVVAATQSALARLTTQTTAIRWVAPAQLHLTLRFLGETPPARATALAAGLAGLASQHPCFPLQTAGLGVFPLGRRPPRILWLGLSGNLPALTALVEQVERLAVTLGWPPTTSPFVPHLTLGRHRDRPAEPLLPALLDRLLPPPMTDWPVTTIDLVVSRPTPAGPHYRSIGCWPLQPLATDGP
jgi:2'-5' RNA ligase